MKPGSLLIPIISALLITSTLVVVSCSKNNTGKPTLSLESISQTVAVQDSMRAMFKFTAGKLLSNGWFSSIRIRTNHDTLTDASGADTLSWQIPSFSASSGEMRYSLPWYGYLAESAQENDTFVFKFFVMTSDSVFSDTITSPKVVVLYQ
jgi:hypothetical protein